MQNTYFAFLDKIFYNEKIKIIKVRIMRALMKIPYDQKDNAKKIAKDNHCALFFGENKLWEFRGNIMPSELERYVQSYLDEPNLTVKSVTAKTKTNENKSLHNYVIDIPFMFRNSLAQYGGFYDKEHKTYIVKAKDLPTILLPYKAKPYSYEAYIEKQINEKDLPLITVDKSELITPRDYQNSAFKVIKKAIDSAALPGFLLADEVGLGKTISAGLVVKEKQFEKILIVTTLSAIAHWRKTMIRMNVGNKDMIIINYDRLQKLMTLNKTYKKPAKSKRTRNKRLASAGEAMEFDLIVWDESHKMKNNTSMRSKIGAKLSEAADFNLYLSATAGQNPLELSYLAPLLAAITGQNVASMEEFEKWCKSMGLGVSRGEFGKWLWDGSDASIEKIHTLLFKSKPEAALRRSPTDIAGYPEISRELTPFELDAERRSQYELAWQEFKHILMNAPKGKTKKGEENVLVAKLRLRQKASLLKIPYTLDMCLDMLEKDKQVAISVNFKETLFELQSLLEKEKVSVAVIHGELNPNEKEDQRMKFQTGQAQVVLFTVEEAISLHQGEYNDVPRVMLIHDLRWSAISMSQIEGRTHRDGKFSQIYWLYFEDSIEEDIAKIVLNRVISMKGMVGDDTKMLKEIEQLLLNRQ